jgi:hypothetical protein
MKAILKIYEGKVYPLSFKFVSWLTVRQGLPTDSGFWN